MIDRKAGWNCQYQFGVLVPRRGSGRGPYTAKGAAATPYVATVNSVLETLYANVWGP